MAPLAALADRTDAFTRIFTGPRRPARPGSSDGNRTFEPGGPAFKLAGLAQVICEATGTRVTYRGLPPAEYVSWPQESGLDKATAHFATAFDASIARGDLPAGHQDLTRLLGRPATPVAAAVRAVWQ